VLSAAALLAAGACKCAPSVLFTTPPPVRRPRTDGGLGLVLERVPQQTPWRSQQELHAASTSHAGPQQGLPWVGLGAPAALLLLAAMEHESRLPRGAFRQQKGSAPSRGERIRLGESAMRMPPGVQLLREREAKKSGASALAIGFFLWYAANVSFNIVNKQALGFFPHAWTVSVVQLATVVACSAAGWATGAIERPFNQMGKGFLWRLLPAAICHALGNGLTSVAFSCGSVSFTHVVKCSEPIWMALGNLAMHGQGLPREQILALVPIMAGVAIATAGELSFTWVGFLAALFSTICFAGRGIFSKRLMTGGSPGDKKMSPLNVYAMDSLLALAFTLPVAALVDGPALSGGGLGAIMAAHGTQLTGLLAATGLAYYAYNAIAFKLLGKLDVVSHAVGNLGKRIFVIGFSILFFSTPLTLRAVLGSATAIAGSGLYSYVKASGGKKPATPAGLNIVANRTGGSAAAAAAA